jgi:hypothetical protein
MSTTHRNDRTPGIIDDIVTMKAFRFGDILNNLMIRMILNMRNITLILGSIAFDSKKNKTKYEAVARNTMAESNMIQASIIHLSPFPNHRRMSSKE